MSFEGPKDPPWFPGETVLGSLRTEGAPLYRRSEPWSNDDTRHVTVGDEVGTDVRQFPGQDAEAAQKIAVAPFDQGENVL